MLLAVRRGSTRLGSRVWLFPLLTAVLVWAWPTLGDFRLAATRAADEPTAASAPPGKTADGVKPDAAMKPQYLSGIVLDEDKRPIPGADVRIYDWNLWLRPERLLHKVLTGPDGRFRLELPSEKKVCRLIASKKGFATLVTGPDHLLPLFREFILSKPVSLRGRVTGPEGQPIAGAKVWTPTLKEFIAGIESAETDAHGYFEIPDLRAWEDDGMPGFFSPPTPEHLAQAKAQAKPGRNKRHLRVRHPDYGLKIGPYSRIPSTVNVSFDKPAVVIGRVVDRTTGKQLGGLMVMLQGDRLNAFAKTLTDNRGQFRLLLQESGKCRLWLEHERRSTGRQVEVLSGQTLDVSEIRVDSSDILHQPQSSQERSTAHMAVADSRSSVDPAGSPEYHGLRGDRRIDLTRNNQ